MKCPTCEHRLVSFPSDDGRYDYMCVQMTCPTNDVVYKLDKEHKPVPKIPATSLDDEIDATLEIFEIIPTNQKPQPDFWAEVSGLISMMDETIARSRSIIAADSNQLETTIQLSLMRDALQKQHDKQTSEAN